MSDASPASTVCAKDRLGWIVIGLFWLVLFALGHPLPIADDISFVGPAFNLSEGKAFANPYTPSMWIVGAKDHYYVYVPLHSFVVTGWIEVFGRTATTLAAFQCLISAWACAALWRVMRGSGTGLFLPLGICFGTIIFLSSTGLRPDAMGLALLSLGAWILRDSSRLAWGACSLCLWLSAITCPNYLIFALLIFAITLYSYVWPARPPMNEILVRLVLVLGALAVVGLLFLYLIDFNLFQFLTVMNGNRARSTQFALLGNLQGITHDSRSFLRVMVQSAEPLVAMLLVTAWTWWQRARLNLPFPSWGILAIAGVGICAYLPALTSATAMRLPALYSILAILFFLSRLKFPVRLAGMGVWCALAFFFFFAIGHHLIQLLVLQLTPVKLEPAAIRSQVDSLNPDHLYVDAFALKAVYDYHLPPGATDYHFSLPNWMPNSPPEDFPPNSVLVVSTQTVNFMERSTLAANTARIRFPWLRRLFTWMVDNPFQFVIISIGPPGSSPKVIPAVGQSTP